MAVVRISADDARSIKGTTNWKKLRALTEKEIVTAALLNPDARLLDSLDLARLRRASNEFSPDAEQGF